MSNLVNGRAILKFKNPVLMQIMHHLILIIEKNNFIVLGEGPTFDIDNSNGAAEKNSINFSKANTKFCLSVHYSGDESFLYVNKTVIYKFKRKDKTFKV